MLCFNEDDYMDLKQDQIGYTNVTTLGSFKYLYDEYGEKTKDLQNKALADLEQVVDFSGSLIRPFKIKQEKLKLFLDTTEQALLDGIYIKKCLWVIERSNYIDKDVLKWKIWDLN